MKLFLDFDDCLFDTTKYPGRFWKDFVEVAKTGGWNEKEIEETAQNFSDSAFDSKRQYHYRYHLELLEKEYPKGTLSETLLRVDHFMQNLGVYLFPDVKPFLEKMQKKEMILITYGDEDFQKAKISGAGIEKYIDEILVAHGEKLSIIEEWVEEHPLADTEKSLWYVDDKAQYFSEGNVEKKPRTVLMQRGEEAKENNDTDFVVKDCRELLYLIEKEGAHKN